MLKPGETGPLTDHMVMIIIMTEESIFVVTAVQTPAGSLSSCHEPARLRISVGDNSDSSVCLDLVNTGVVTLSDHVSVSLSVQHTAGDYWRLVVTGL